MRYDATMLSLWVILSFVVFASLFYGVNGYLCRHSMRFKPRPTASCGGCGGALNSKDSTRCPHCEQDTFDVGIIGTHQVAPTPSKRDSQTSRRRRDSRTHAQCNVCAYAWARREQHVCPECGALPWIDGLLGTHQKKPTSPQKILAISAIPIGLLLGARFAINPHGFSESMALYGLALCVALIGVIPEFRVRRTLRHAANAARQAAMPPINPGFHPGFDRPAMRETQIAKAPTPTSR